MRWRGREQLTPIGVDIDSRTISAAQLRRAPDAATGWEVSASIALPRLNPDAEVDRAEIQRFSEVLLRHGFSGSRIVLAVPNAHLLTGVFDLPPANSGAPLDQLARMELARMHKCEPRALELTYWELPARLRTNATTEGRNATHVMAAACRSSDVTPLLDLFECESWDVAALDLQSWATVRACQSLPAAQDVSTAMLSLRWDAATLVLLHQGVVAYERVIDEAGWRHLHQAIMAQSGVSSETVDYLLTNEGLNITSETAGLAGSGASTVISIVSSHLDMLMREIRTSCSYLSHRYADAGAGPRQVVLLGEGAAVPGLAAHMAKGLAMQVTMATPGLPKTGLTTENGGLETQSSVQNTQSSSLMTAIGLAMNTTGLRAETWALKNGLGVGDQGFASELQSVSSESPNPQTPTAIPCRICDRSINLIPMARQESRHRHSRVRVWVKVAGAYGLLMALALTITRVWSGFDSRTASSTLSTLQSEIQHAEGQVKMLRADLRTAYRAWQTAGVVADQPDWSLLLAALAHTMDEDLALRSCRLVSHNRTDAPAPPNSQSAATNAVHPHVLTIAGLGKTQLAVSEFVVRLEQLGIFNSVTLVETRREPFLENDAIAFRLTCSLGNAIQTAVAPTSTQ